MPERLECKVGLLQKARYINTLTFTFYLYAVRTILYALLNQVVFSSYITYIQYDIIHRRRPMMTQPYSLPNRLL